MLEIRVLGQFELRRNGDVVQLSSRPAQSLLAYLALSAGTAHRREKLAGLLWPDSDDANARNSLRHALWRIRKAIEPDDGAPLYLLADEFAVSFNAGADYWLDAAALTRDADALQDVIETVVAYRGELLPGFYDDWVTLERERAESIFQHKMQRLLDGLVEQRRWPDVLEWGQRWVALGHAPEPGYRALMRAYAELGDRSRMAAMYQRCREALFNDLGVEPSIQTRRLFERLRADDADLEPAPPTSATNEAPAAGDPPFQGLHYFDVADADRFFGRERLTARLLSRVRLEPFLAVVGASGSGKSSVVRAGLVPAIRRSPNDWAGRVYILTPTASPLEALATSLAPQNLRAVLIEDLGRDRHGLRRFLQDTNGQTCVLVIDQFEEVFTLCQDHFEREAFIENLLGAVDARGPVRVVIALRADFYMHCAQYPILREVVGQHQEFVGPLDTAELQRAIEVPAALGGWELEAGLVQFLLRDVGEEPGALPLLSHALLETWQRRRGRTLTFAGYSASGGVQGAIAQTAEAVFAERLSLDQKVIARRIFLRLTELGEGTQDTRRRATLDELVRIPDEEPDVRTVLRELVAARLVTLGAGTAEVAHEALIREWSRLRAWLAEDRDALRIQRQLSAATRDWEGLGREPGSMYRGTRLSQAVEWADDHPTDLGRVEREFLEASARAAAEEVSEREAQRERELRAAQQLAEAEQARADEQRQNATRLRQRALLLSVAFAVAVLTAATAVFFGNTARQQAILAEGNARAAVSRALAAAALSNLSVDPERAALLALQAIDATYPVDATWTPEAEDALHRVAPLLRAQLTLVGHTGKVQSVAFSADGLHVATAGDDATVRLWNALTGRSELTLVGHAGPVNAVSFSPDGSLVATASDDGTVRVWDAVRGQPRLTLAGHTREVERVAFSPDGSQIVTSSLDGDVMQWDLATGRNLFTFHPGRVAQSGLPVDVVISSDGTRLATAVPSGEVQEWDLSNQPPRLLRTWLSSSTGVAPHTVAFSPDGTRIATTTDSGAQLWWTLTGEPSLNIVGHPLHILDATFSPDGTRIATGSADQTARLWDAGSGRELLSLAGHTGPVDQVAFSPDGERLATASWDGTAKIWDLGPARELMTLSTPGTLSVTSFTLRTGDAPRLGQIAVSNDARIILAGLWDATAKVWNAQTGDELATLTGHAGQVWGAAISPDGTRFATGSDDRTVRVWDTNTAAVLWIGVGHTDRVVAVAFSPDGSRLASASTDGIVKVWDVATGGELLTLSGQSNGLTSVAFSPDGAELVTASEGTDDNVRVWDVRSGGFLRHLAGHQDAVWSVGFSPDGRRILTSSRDETVRIWDAVTGKTLLTVQSHTGTPVTSVFSPDGRRLATGSRDGTVELVDAETGHEELTLEPADIGEGIDSLTFSPDGRQLIVRTDQAVRIYAVPIEDMTALIRSRITRWWTQAECQRFLHVDQCSTQTAMSSPGSAPRVAPRWGPVQTPVTAVQAPAVPVPMLASTSPLVGTIKIVSSMSRDAFTKAMTDQVIKAYKMALEARNYQIGNATIVLQDLSDSNASKATWDAPRETMISQNAVNDPDVLVYLGPTLSGAARVAIPILCPAQLPIIASTTTYPGLTKTSPNAAAGEPDVYYPNCKRNFARVVPTDEQQGAVAAQFVKQLGMHSVYVLNDGGVYGLGLAGVFIESARRSGLDVVGADGIDPSATDYQALAAKIHQAHPDLVYFGGIEANNAAKLWQDLRAVLGTTVTLMGADGINDDAFVRAAGSASEGTYATFPGVPAEMLTGKGAEWYQRYKAAFNEEPMPWVAYGYEAMNVALDAIARIGKKDRAAIRDAILATRDYDGVLGRWSFTETGDTTLTTMSVRQVRHGAWDSSTARLVETSQP